LSPAFDIELANPFGGSWEDPVAGWNPAYWQRFHAMMEHAAQGALAREPHRGRGPA
jgi:hypothetical protein